MKILKRRKQYIVFYIDIKHNIRYDYCVTHSRLGGGRHHHAHWRITETDAAGLPRQGRLYGVPIRL